MKNLSTLLEQANVRRTLIVDDAYDQIPLAGDLLDADEWTHFFEDLTDTDIVMLRAIYPRYDEIRADELQTLDDFIGALWQNRGQLRSELIEPLFARYVMDTRTDLAYLTDLVRQLRSFGLTCNTAGRRFQEEAGTADLIVIDLFLGSMQSEEDFTTTIAGLVEVVRDRPSRPPLVLLMSRSPRLEMKREEFRNRSGLFESAFRIIGKGELAEAGKLQRLLIRLASHYSDSLKLATFLHAWNTGLEQARQRTSSLIRMLDLADHAQIRQLLLSAEGEPTGSYLVDVFDRVLQHEIEAEAPIIDAAITLNSLTSETYPPPYVAGSRDLQDLVFRSLFQHRERLRLMGAEGSRIAFGDLLRRKPLPAGMAAASASHGSVPLSDIATINVLAVLTPACDLQRNGAKRILLLVGTLQPLQPADWSYKDVPIRTPVIELAGGQRCWIKWDLKHLETLSASELDQMLSLEGEFETIARLRESHALELQQKLISNLGRVGLIAKMPATFPMRVEAYLPNAAGKLVLLNTPELSRWGGVCYVGRDEKGDRRDCLVVCEDACESISAAIESVDLAQIHLDAHELITDLRTSGVLQQALERGVSLPIQSGQKDILLLNDSLKEDNSSNMNPRVVGLVMRNKDVDKPLHKSDIKRAGVVLATWDQ